MKRPYVICHMGFTVDGRIIGEHWGEDHEKFGSLYEHCHNTFSSQAWMVGRVTMEKDFTEGKQPELQSSGNAITREPFIGDKAATSFAIAVDPSGKLGWGSNEIDGDHVIEILTEQVSDDYLYYLQEQGVSYLFGGKNDVDFVLALSQLATLFPIETIMLEGGGHINGSLLNAGLIDELSLLILPIADGTPKTPTTFEVNDYLPKKATQALQLLDIKKLEHDMVWLRYKMI